MKKNVKYIGSAIAVALLAAGAPVVIPMMVPTSMIQVKADGIPNPNETPLEMLTKFRNQFDDRYVAGTDSLTSSLDALVGEGRANYFYFGPSTSDDPNGYQHIYDIQNDGYLANLKDKNKEQSPTYFHAPGNDWYYYDIHGYLTISSGGKVLKTTTPDDLSSVSAGIKNGTIRFPLTITVHLLQGTNDGIYDHPSLQGIPDDLKTFSFKIGLSQFDIKTTNESVPSLHTGTTLSDSSLTTGNSLYIDDNYTGDSKYTASLASAEKPIYGQSLFTDKDDALDYAKSDTFDPQLSDKGNASDDQFKDNLVIEKPGVYYQTVSYNLKGDGSNGTSPAGADQAIGYMISGGVDPLTKSTIAMYTTYIDDQKSTDYAFNKNTGMLTIARKISVGKSLNAKLTTPTVNTGTATSSIDTTGNTIVDGNDTIPSNVAAGDTYYTDDAATNVATSDEVDGGVFKKAGTYYRKLTFTLTNGKTSDYNISGDLSADRTDTTVTYLQEIDVKNGTVPTIKTASANIGDSTSEDSVTKGNDLANNDGSLLDTTKGDYAGVSFGKTYYQEDATEANKAAIIAGKGENAVDGVVSSDGTTFEKAGSYLRTITFYLTKEEIANNSFDDVDPNVQVNVRESTVTYVQQIKISAVGIKPKIDNPVVSIGTKINDDKLTDTTNNSFDYNGESLLNTSEGSKGIELGTTFYDDPQLNTPTTDITNDVLNKAKTYYRTIKFYLTDEAFNNYSFSDAYGSPNENDKSVTYVQSVTVSPAETSTFNNSGLNVLAGTTTDGADISGRQLTDTTEYILKDDKDGTKVLNNSDDVTIGNYYATEDDAATENNPLTITDFEANKTYFRTITIKVASGDGYSYTYPGANSVDKDKDLVTYIQKINVGKDQATVKVGSINDVKSGTMTSTLNNDFTGDSVVNSTGSIVATDGISFGTDYYDNPTDALNGNISEKSARVTSDGQIIGGQGTLYRTITFTLNKGAVDQNTFVPGIANEDYKINGDTITYVQSINVISNAAQVSINPVTGIKTGTLVKDSDVLADSTISANGVSVIDETKDIKYGTKYYDSIEDYRESKESVDVQDGIFTNAHRYFREVTIPLKENVTTAYNFGGNNFVRVNDDNSVTYLQEVDVEKANASLDSKPVTVKAGSNVSDDKAEANNSLTSDNGDSVVGDKGIQYGTTYYDADSADEDVLIGIATTEDAVSNGKYSTPGTYKRRVVFHLQPNAATEYTFPGKQGINYMISGNTIIYVQKVTVSAIPAMATINPVTGIEANTKTSDSESFGSNSSITADGQSIIDTTGSIQYGTEYYDSIDDYKANKPSKDVSNGTFNATHNYYRTVTVPLINGASSYEFSGDNYVSVDKSNNTVTYLQEVKVSAGPTKANFADLHTYTGVPITSTLNDTSNYTLTDSTGSIILDGDDNIQLGTSYYASAQDAIDGTNPLDVSKDDVFTKNGDVYRTVTFNLKPGVTDRDYFADEINKVQPKLNGTTSVTYAQKIDVDRNAATATIMSSTVNAYTSISDVPESTGNELVDKKNISVVKDNGIKIDNSKFYDNLTDYKAGKTSSDIVDGKFSKAKTYYRAITFSLKPGVASADDFLGNDLAKVDTSENTVTYLQPVIVESNNAIATINGIETNVTVSTNDSSLNDANGSDIISKYDSTGYGSIVADNGISYGTTYYDHPDEVLHGGSVSKDVSNNRFLKGDKFYYRAITFKLKDGALSANKLGDNPAYKLNKDGTLTYAQAVRVDKAKLTPTTTPTINVDSGTNVVAEQNSENNDIKDNDNVSLIKDITFGEYYPVSTNKEVDVLNNVAKNKAVGVTDGTNYIKPGTYYRTVTFNLKENVLDANALDNSEFKVDGVTNTVTFVQTVTINSIPATITVNLKTVTVGTATDDINSTSDYKMKSGDSVIDSNVQLGDLYKSSDAALNSTASEKADVISNNRIVKSGKYFRTVTFTPTTSSLDEYTFADKNAHVHDGTVTYIQEIDVKPIASEVAPADIPEIKAKDPINKLPDGSKYVLRATDQNHTSIPTEVKSDTVYEDSNLNTPVKNGIFDKAKTYYRAITFKPTDLSAENYEFNDPNITKNSDGTITYVQPIMVNKNDGSTVNWTDDSSKGQNLSVNVTVDKEDDSALSNTEDYDLYDLTDANSNSLVDKKNNNGISFSSEYYNINSDGTAGEKSNYASGFKIMRPGTYYRQVTFSLLAGVSEDYDFSSLPGYVSSDDNSVTVNQKITATALTPSDDIKDASTTTGTSSTAKSVENPADITLTGKDKVSLIKSDPTFDGFYDKDGNKVSDVVDKNGNFAKAGTYYQKITIPLTDNADYAYDFDSLNGTVNHDAENPTVTFMRAITVNQHHSSSSTNKGNNTGTEDEWTYYQDAGVVTTKTTEPTYSLNNHANETIQNRALSENSSWVTDQYRVNNRTGVKQYRVATGEWIDANDVYFRDNGNGTGTEDEWTYYKDPGVVLTKETQEYYSLNNHANETIQNRALSEDSGWITDQYRVNNRTGVKQYRVATGEWIDSHDVIFVKDVQMIVNVDETKDYYNLYDIQKNTNSNRVLEKKTSWLSDKVAIDYDGSTYYRVATNEWVKQENGVHLDTSVWYKN